MKNYVIFSIVALIATVGTVSAQQNYAVLIAGNMQPDSQIIPPAEQWNGGNDAHPVHGFDEFWNDIYLQWEMLVIHKDYTDANVHVLFGDGDDFTFFEQANRYKASYNGYQNVTDASSNKQTISSTFSSLANTITEDDFLYIWIMSHGGTDGNSSYFYSYDNQKLYADDLAALLGNISAHKKVVVLSFPNSGGFLPVLEADDTIIITAGGAMEGASRADDMAPNGPFIENEIRDGIVYNHGEMNYHLTSAITGQTPLEVTTYAGSDLSDADWFPQDGYITIEEAYDWLNYYHTSNEYPGYDNPIFSQFYGTLLCDLEYPTIIWWDIISGWDIVLSGLIGITVDLFVESDASLTLSENSIVHLIPNLGSSSLFIHFDAESTFGVEDYVTFFSALDAFTLNIMSLDVNIGRNFSFTSDNYNSSSLLKFNNQSSSYDFYISTFENINLEVIGYEVGIANSLISDSKISIQAEDFSSNDVFSISSEMKIENTALVRIDRCIFYNLNEDQMSSTSNVAIELTDCIDYVINECMIMNYFNHAIKVNNSGNSIGLNQVKDNTISDNAQSSAAIRIYNSMADIVGSNYITGSETGIESLNNSQVSLLGVREATFVHETQQIYNNNHSQIYASYGAFPYEVRFNAIYGNNHDYLFYYDTNEDEVAKDVSYNYWGSGFDPYDDLYPTDQFSWLPVWNLQTLNPPLDDGEDMFYTAKMLADTGNFTQAKSTFREVVSQYPDTKYAVAALKELFAIESGADNDFAALRSYYLSLITEQSPDGLVKIADFFANRCNIVLEDYQDAVDWYEAVIADPPSFPDSLFAIIDLGYLYLQMENSGLKSAVKASMPHYNPESKTEHTDYKDYLISLLYRDTKQEQPLIEGLTGESLAILYPNTPNPFTGSTAINYELTEDCRVLIRIFDHAGRTIKEVDQGYKPAGNHRQTIDLQSLRPGMYLCSLEANGITSGTQKLLKVK